MTEQLQPPAAVGVPPASEPDAASLVAASTPASSPHAAIGVCEHPPGSEHTSVVHAFESEQSSVNEGAQTPTLQVLVCVQTSPSSHATPSATKAFVGHAGADPVQVSSMSHGPATGRHESPEAANESPGH